MTKITHTSRKLSALLMVGASSLAVASPAKANEYLFTQETKPLQIGERQTQTERLTQVRLNGGGTASFTDKAEYQVNSDGSVELYKGSVTVAGAAEQTVMVRMPGGLEGEVMGRGSAANFRVQADGEATGHVLTGKLRLGRNKRWRRYDAGAMWAAGRGSMPRRVVANQAQTAPQADDAQPQVAAISDDAVIVRRVHERVVERCIFDRWRPETQAAALRQGPAGRTQARAPLSIKACVRSAISGIASNGSFSGLLHRS